jgi:hypothetical protein
MKTRASTPLRIGFLRIKPRGLQSFQR